MCIDCIVPLKARKLVYGFIWDGVRISLYGCKIQRSQKGTHDYVRIISGSINSLLIISLEQELDINECFLSKTFK
jgi:hypothetical protein